MSTAIHPVTPIELDPNQESGLNYYNWNKLIADHFFNSEKSGQSVYVYVTKPLLDELGKHCQVDHRDFIRAVIEGPSDVSDERLNLCGKARTICRDWNKADRDYRAHKIPPHLAYLAFFVIASNEEVEASEHSYYPGLNKLMDRQENAGSPAGFKDMWELWQDLEEWTNSDRDGQLGIFTFQILGAHCHVGLPKSQTILTDSDRVQLTQLFASHSFDPDNPPPDSYLYGCAKREARQLFSNPTQRRFQQDRHTAETLKAVIACELKFWDGVFESNEQDSNQQTSHVSLPIRLCFTIDRITNTSNLTVRCKTNREYPHSGLRLKTTDSSLSLSGEEHGFGWSECLCEDEQLSPFNPIHLDWKKSHHFRDETTNWIAKLRLEHIHIFKDGSEEGIQGYVETDRLKADTKQYLLVHQNAGQLLDHLQQECERCCQLDDMSGLPKGWSLIEVNGISDGASLRDFDLRLDMKSSLKVGFAGGIKATDGRSKTYFNFDGAKPYIEVSGSAESNRPDVLMVTHDGNPLIPREDDHSKYDLPVDLPVNTRISFSVDDSSQNEVPPRKLNLELVEPTFTSVTTDISFDVYGDILENQEDGSIGANVQTEDLPRFPTSFQPCLDKNDTDVCHLIGRNPGEYSKWNQSNPPVWKPAWIVVKKRDKFTIIPCMDDVDTAHPSRSCVGSVSDLKLWKKYIQSPSQKTAMPPFPAHAELWKQYIGAAKDV